MRRLLSPGTAIAIGLVLLAAVVATIVLPSNDYVFLPDRAHPVAPLVTLPHNKDAARGSIYFVDVIVQKATLLERLFGGLHHGATLVPAAEVDPPGVGDAQRRQIDLQDMQRSQQIAAAVALRADGNKHVVLRATGALVDEVEAGMPAVGKLAPDDVITAVNGTPVHTLPDVVKAIEKVKIGAVVRFTIRRDKKTLVESIKTVASTPADGPPKRPVVGVALETALDIHLPYPVRIDAGNVGGPSAGLAFALQVLQDLGRNVAHGHKVAATGEIEPDGTVEPIGGIKQKTIGAREAGVDVFLVPVDNAADARKEAHGLRIIPVRNFQQALHALATLGPAS